MKALIKTYTSPSGSGGRGNIKKIFALNMVSLIIPLLLIVIDTNVLIAGLRSQFGASFRLLELIGTGKFEIVISVPLVLEYETVAKRMKSFLGLANRDIDDIIDYICSAGIHQEIYYLWRPFLRDPKDDMILELAVNATAQFIITHNMKDFSNIVNFGIEAMTPKQFLKLLNEKI